VKIVNSVQQTASQSDSASRWFFMEYSFDRASTPPDPSTTIIIHAYRLILRHGTLSISLPASESQMIMSQPRGKDANMVSTHERTIPENVVIIFGEYIIDALLYFAYNRA
jgi:hypothetical protein